MRCEGVIAAMMLAAPMVVYAQDVPPPPASEATAAAEAQVVPARSEVDIAILADLDSKTAKPGERFRIRLAEPITINGITVVPEGLEGEGEVVHAAKARWGGKAGEMILAARYLTCGTGRIELGWFKLRGAGSNNVGEAIAATAIVPVAAFIVSGGEMRVPKGTRALAKTRAPIEIPAGASACAPVGEVVPRAEGGTK